MNRERLSLFIDWIDARLREKYGSVAETYKEVVLSRLAKITEEVGELSEAVLVSWWNQRDDKVKDYTEEQLSDEFADVIITTFLLAKAMDVDMWKALENKIKNIEKKFS